MRSASATRRRRRGLLLHRRWPGPRAGAHRPGPRDARHSARGCGRWRRGRACRLRRLPAAGEVLSRPVGHGAARCWGPPHSHDRRRQTADRRRADRVRARARRAADRRGVREPCRQDDPRRGRARRSAAWWPASETTASPASRGAVSAMRSGRISTGRSCREIRGWRTGCSPARSSITPAKYRRSSPFATRSSARPMPSPALGRGHAGAGCSVLYRPEAFDPLTERPWDEDWVRREIGRIVADADAAYDPVALWPAEEWDSWQTPTPLKALYVGGAGVVWALGALERRGHAESELDLSGSSTQRPGRVAGRARLHGGIELPSPARAGLLAGEAGILTVAWQLTRDDALADTLFERVAENVENDANEIMWGSPGTMLAARRHVRVDRRQTLADGLARERRRADAEPRGRRPLDDPPLRRRTGRSLGPAHGLVGNVLALRQRLRGAEESRWNGSRRPRSPRRAVVEDGLANWANQRRWRSPVVFGSSRHRHRRRPTTSTRSCSWPARSSSGRRGRTATRRATASATARPATATRC